MAARFGDVADIFYLDVERRDVRESRSATLSLIREQGLAYPVTVIDGIPAYDGIVSYPAILLAVQRRLKQIGLAE